MIRYSFFLFFCFAARSIIPKLQLALRDFAVNPHKQLLEPIKWVFSWSALAAPRLLVHLLCGFFFPKWFQALYQWLSNNPDYGEVQGWYVGWRDLFPAKLIEHVIVKQMLSRGLDLMNAAVDEKPLLPLLESINAAVQAALNSPALAGPAPSAPSSLPGVPPSSFSYVPPSERETKAKAQVKPTISKAEQKAAVLGVEDESMSFKDVIHRFAEMNSIEFVPNIKRGVKDGKQIYSFGKLNVYIDGQAIYAFLPDSLGGGVWKPISLQEMLEKAH